ncbi:nuclear factor 7, ovary-like isoform X2 [Alosa pseudoharengus]|uniref:nuclear factor 7, ovary-like isoform X2 n=1 Tax=Alosa pseudoharengus TaxID=34774 RepID=UPI003F89869A
MAEAPSNQDLTCPICLDLLNNPVTLNCGHNVCMGCITRCWNQEDPKGVYNCPHCRQTFSPRPVLNKNTIVAERVEHIKRTRIQNIPSTGSSNKRKQMGKTQIGFQQIIQEREKELQELRKAVETLKSSAQTAVEDSERIFTEMLRLVERRRSEVTELIRAQEKAEVSRAKGLLKKLEQEIAELKRRDAELEQLAHTDGLHSLQVLPFEAVKKSVSILKWQLEDFLKQEIKKIAAAVGTNIPIIRSVEVSEVNAVSSVGREEFLQYSCNLTLDPNTANRYLHLSEGNRRVTFRAQGHAYPEHPERFDGCCQVLCSEGVSGRCYWEVEWSGEVDIAVSYKSISRKGGGGQCGFGCNNQTWRLILSSSRAIFFLHNKKETKLPLVASSRIGVYVDHRAGTLAFYSISDTMTLLHRVQTTFTHTLYPGFGLDAGSSVKLL